MIESMSSDRKSKDARFKGEGRVSKIHKMCEMKKKFKPISIQDVSVVSRH